MELSKDQKIVYDLIMDNIKNKSSLTTIGGYAGTGKTFLISKIRENLEKENLNIKIAFVCFTGKASLVLKQKLGKINEKNHYIGTIHSLIYKPEFRYSKKIKRMLIYNWIKVPKNDLNFDFIFIDESSMVSEEIFKDLKSYNIPILAFGDHGQLPPISNSFFNLMKDPDYKLEEIHRQSKENPIIKLAELARKYGKIPFGIFSSGVAKLNINDDRTMKLFYNIDFKEDVIVLCGMNKTRVELNNKIRENLGFSLPEPYPGERVICLRNNKSSGIFNGQLGTLLMLTYETKEILEVCIQMDGEEELFSGLIYYPMFGKEKYSDVFSILKEKDGKENKLQKITKNTEYDYVDFFDWGNIITVHKSQGSQWNRVILFEERNYYMDDLMYSKFLYTAITRSENKLLVIGYD